MKRRTLTFLLLAAVFCNYLAAQVNVERGPYVQLATQNSIYIKWRTSATTESRVIYGTAPSSLTQTVTDNTLRTEHELRITGLQPNTQYYYSIGNGANILSSGPDQYFMTQPPAGTRDPFTFWVIGDCGTGNSDQRAVRDAYLNYMVGQPHPEGLIMLGDNAYDFGLDGQYQDALFNNMYEDIVSNTVMWPTPGNHDYYGGADASSQTGAYYDIFRLPAAGEAGGYPSGTEAYYSWNYGNIHFVSLDSYDSPRDSAGAMGNWLKLDLQQNQQEWTIVYWHHAPYTKGSHDSDNPFPWLNGELVDMREQILPVIERYGVDLVLCGHSHSYERSYLMDGHYGNSGSLTQSMILDNGSGNFTSDCPYRKNTAIAKSHKGTVYTVCGVSGKKSGTSSGWPLSFMEKATVDHFGSMILQVNRNRLDARFITSANQVYDSFTILKNAGGKKTYKMCRNDTLVLQPSFPASQYQWFPGNSTQLSLPVSPVFSTVYYGKDPLGCVTDTFQVNVVQPGSTIPDTCAISLTGTEGSATEKVAVYPNPASRTEPLVIDLSGLPAGAFHAELWDGSGRIIHTAELEGKKFNVLNLPSVAPSVITGFLRIYNETQTYYHKIIFTP